VVCPDPVVDSRPQPAVVAVVPLKAIGSSKTRMAPALSPDDRALLLRRTFDRVVAAARRCVAVTEVLVVVGDDRGASWAMMSGASIVRETPGPGGLNAALAEVDASLGKTPSLVIPADLPLVTGEDLDAMVEALPGVPGVVVCPTADGGTGGLLRAPGGIVPPCYGPGSADAHVDAARRAGVPVRRLLLPGLALDLDRPSDIALAGGWRAVTAGSEGPGGAGDSETRPVERYPHR